MGPELLLVAIQYYGLIFATLGLLMGAFVKRPMVLVATIIAMAAVLGIANGINALPGLRIVAGLVAFFFVVLVAGAAAGTISLCRWLIRQELGANSTSPSQSDAK